MLMAESSWQREELLSPSLRLHGLSVWFTSFLWAQAWTAISAGNALFTCFTEDKHLLWCQCIMHAGTGTLHWQHATRFRLHAGNYGQERGGDDGWVESNSVRRIDVCFPSFLILMEVWGDVQQDHDLCAPVSLCKHRSPVPNWDLWSVRADGIELVTSLPLSTLQKRLLTTIFYHHPW